MSPTTLDARANSGKRDGGGKVPVLAAHKTTSRYRMKRGAALQCTLPVTSCQLPRASSPAPVYPRKLLTLNILSIAVIGVYCKGAGNALIFFRNFLKDVGRQLGVYAQIVRARRRVLG